MEKLDFVKKRLEMAADKGIVEHEKGDKKIGELVNDLVKGPKRYKRLVAALTILGEIMPDPARKKLARFLDTKDFSELPFDPDKFTVQEKIGEGYVSKVYLIESKTEEQPSFVLKLDFCNSGNIDELAETAAKQHKEYERIREYYRGLPDLIPVEQSLIVGPRKDKKPAIATLQEFAGRELRDIFKDIGREELLLMLRDCDDFRDEFIEFTDQTANLESSNGEMIDLLGEKNLVTANINGWPHLRFIDPHNISSTSSQDKDRNRRLKEALDYLRGIRKEAEKFQVEEKMAA